MKNRVDKLMKEKRRALSQIKVAKNRSMFMQKVNHSKSRDKLEKEKFRQMMRDKLEEQQKYNAEKRREMKENIRNSHLSKIEEKRTLKVQEHETKLLKKAEKADNFTAINLRVKNLSDSIKQHRTDKKDKIEKMKTFKNDMSQIRYYLKNENLDLKKKSNYEEIELLKKKEQEILEKLKHTLERQDQIEREIDSPIKIRRAPSLTNQAKLMMFNNKFEDKSKVTKRIAQLDQTPMSGMSREESYFNDGDESVVLRKNQDQEAEQQA